MKQIKDRTLETIRMLAHLFVVRPLIKCFFRIHVRGEKHFSMLRQFMVIANHNSHLDVFMVYLSLPIRHIIRTHPVAAGDYFSRSKLLFWLVEFLFQPVWIYRTDEDKNHRRIEKIKSVLIKGHNLILFPEGTRGRPGVIERFKSGIGRLTQQFPELPVVPVFLSGAEKAFPKGAILPAPVKIKVTVSRPLFYQESYKHTTFVLENVMRQMAYCSDEFGSEAVYGSKPGAFTGVPQLVSVFSLLFTGLISMGQGRPSHA
jgi:1-acyl-sn-glycerol-3-phosphate acyltransferase